MRVGIGEAASQQHLVRAQPGAGHGVVRLEGGLLDLGVVVGDVTVQRQLAHVDQRIVAVRPYLRQVERVEPVGLGLLERHDLHLERPARMIAALDRLIEVPLVVIAVLARQPVGVLLGQEFNALIADEVVLHPEDLVSGIDPAVGVAAVAIHVPPALGDAPIAHQPGHLMRGLRRETPEVPLHVVVPQVGCGHALLRPDEVLELQRVAHEEDRRVVADHVEVASGRIELQRESARVPPGVWAAALAGDGGEPDQRVGLGARRKHLGSGVFADVVGHFEVAERATALGMRLAFRDAFPVELGHLLDQVVILQQDRTVGADRQRLFVTGCGDARVGGGVALRDFSRPHGADEYPGTALANLIGINRFERGRHAGSRCAVLECREPGSSGRRGTGAGAEPIPGHQVRRAHRTATVQVHRARRTAMVRSPAPRGRRTATVRYPGPPGRRV